MIINPSWCAAGLCRRTAGSAPGSGRPSNNNTNSYNNPTTTNDNNNIGSKVVVVK